MIITEGNALIYYNIWHKVYQYIVQTKYEFFFPPYHFTFFLAFDQAKRFFSYHTLMNILITYHLCSYSLYIIHFVTIFHTESYQSEWHTQKLGPGTILGPYKNRKTGTRDPTKSEKPGPYKNRKAGTWEPRDTLAGPYKNRKIGTQDPRQTGEPESQ